MNLLHYIQGGRKGKEAHRIEREAMQDAFLREALEGFESVEGDHAAAIRRMQQQIAGRSHQKNRSITLWLSIAASVALVIGSGWYFLLHETPQAPVLSKATHTETPVDSVKEDKALDMKEQTWRQESKKTAKQDRPLQREASPPPSPTKIADLEIATEDMDTPAVEAMEDARMATSVEPIAARRVRGKVVDESGDPMPGVNITVKNRTAGVVTDTGGEFALDTDDHATLQASFIGYETQEIKADTSQLLIAMHEDARQLEEVVVIGYGTAKNHSVTGAVSTVEEPEPQAATAPVPTIGRRAYKKYLKESLIAPVDGECAGVKGKVRVRFSVDQKGRPYNLRVTRKLCDAADREAMRLITEGCDWTQGNAEVTVTVEF